MSTGDKPTTAELIAKAREGGPPGAQDCLTHGIECDLGLLRALASALEESEDYVYTLRSRAVRAADRAIEAESKLAALTAENTRLLALVRSFGEEAEGYKAERDAALTAPKEGR